MKQFFFSLLLLIFCAGCAKTEFQYAVFCDFTPLNTDQSWIVVSNDAGDILQHFEIAKGQNHLSQQFNYQADAAEDVYNLHLVGLDSSGGATIFSHYGVKNGAGVVFWPEYLYPNPFNSPTLRLHLFIKDLPALDSFNMPGVFPVHSVNFSNYNAASRILEIRAVLHARTDFLLRIRSTPSAPFHSLFMPAALLTDSTSIHWNDLIPESNLQNVALPDNDNHVGWFRVDALQADFQHTATLASVNSSTIPQFNFPAGVDPNSLLRISTRQGYYTRDKIFQPGEVLKIEKADMDVTSANLSPEGALKVKTKGAIDLLEVNLSVNSQNRHAIWSVQGEPSALEHAILPDLSSLLPNWVSLSAVGPSISVSAYQYDQLTYHQLREGFPYKGNAGRMFPEARYGLKRMFKHF